MDLNPFDEIEPGLLVGGAVDYLPPGAGAVLNVCEREDTYRCEYHRWAAILDQPPAPPLSWLVDQVRWVEEQRAAGRGVFVHCRGGVSRSPTVAAAYLMKRHGWAVEAALACVLKARAIHVPRNEHFMDLLREWGRWILPTLTLVIPTVGRPTLARCLASVRRQDWHPGDEVLLVGDGIQPAARALWDQYGLPGRYLETATRLGHWGHGVRNWVHGFGVARASHLAALDDDDEWAPDALAAVRAALVAAPGRPHLFRMRGDPCGGVVWREPVIRHGNVGTPMLVAPNDPARLGVYDPRQGGDCDFIGQTCGFYAAGPVWHARVICLVRPPR